MGNRKEEPILSIDQRILGEEVISEKTREVHLMKVTPASCCCLPCLPFPISLLEGLVG